VSWYLFYQITPTYGEVKTRATGTGYAQLGVSMIPSAINII